jgi:hypothetical protein
MSARVLGKGLPVAMAVASLALFGAAAQAGAAMPWWHLNVYSSPASQESGEGTVTVTATNLGDAATKTECVKATVAEGGNFNDSECTKPAATGFFHKPGEGEWERRAVSIKIVDTLPEGVTVTTRCIEVVARGSVKESGKYNNANCTVPNKGNKLANPPEGEWELGPGSQGDGQATQEGKNSDAVPIVCKQAGQTVTCTLETFPVASYETLTVAINVKVEKGKGSGPNEASVEGGGAAPVTSKKALALSDNPPPFGPETYELTPEEEGGLPDTQAGNHPFQLTTTIALNTHTAPVAAGTVGFGEAHQFPEVQPIGAFAKDLRFKLPPGLIGNPVPLPKCSVKLFSEWPHAYCPNKTVIGVASATVAGSIPENPLITNPVYSLEPGVGEPARFGFQTGLGPVFLDVSVLTGGDYGVVVTVPDIIQSLEFVRSQVTFWGVPADPRHNAARGPECARNLMFRGPLLEPSCAPETGETPFLIMPTSCPHKPATGQFEPLRTSVEGDSWGQPGSFTAPKEYAFQNSEGGLLEQVGCDALNFAPSIEVKPDSERASTPSGLRVDVHVDQEGSLTPTGLAESAVKDTTVTLPAGVAVNPAAADGLDACSDALIGYLPGESNPPESLRFTPRLPGSLTAITAGERAPLNPGVNFCPEAAKIATVQIHTPLLEHDLEGSVYLAAQNANPFGSLVAIYIVAEDPVSGVLIKLAGEVKLDPGSGQLVTTFNNTPPLPFEDLVLHFFGGPRAPLGTPALCGSYTTSASFKSWSGETPNVSSPPFQITSGPNGGPCPNPPGDMSPSTLPFNPSLTAGAVNIQAGAFTPFTMTMSHADGNQNLDAVQLKMPPGLLGTLSGVKLCGEAQGNAGTCGPESLIGETTVSVGLGGNPFTVKGGRVYITGPYEGAPYGLSIVNPAKAGPFDVEHDTSNPNYQPACDCLVVRAKIEVDPITATLTITSDSIGPHAIPQILDGIPLQIQHVNVTINRPYFTFNPTSCSPMKIGGALTSSQGATSALAVPFQVTNCATLAFKPQFKVSTAAKTSRKNGASLDVKLSYPKGSFGRDANIAKVKVDLPKQLPSRLTTLQKACPASTFNTDPASCPAASRVGSAIATTPIIPVPLSGPAYFVSHGGAKFPELVIVLSGYGTTVQLHGETFISKKGITSSTFRQVPDVPIGTFELKLPQGANSALAANTNLCKIKKGGLKMPTAFTAQNGAVIHQSTKITVTDCPKHTTRKAKKK